MTLAQKVLSMNCVESWDEYLLKPHSHICYTRYDLCAGFLIPSDIEIKTQANRPTANRFSDWEIDH